MTTKHQLARDVLSLADDGGMPDSFRETDQRVRRALDTLQEARLEIPEHWRGFIEPERRSRDPERSDSA